MANGKDIARPKPSAEQPTRRKSRLRRWTLWVSALLVLLALLVLPQMLSAPMVYSAKAGRVVNEATGKGIPGVTVLAKGNFSAGLYYGSQNACLYGLSVLTDADGYFELPSTWSRAPIGLPFFGKPRTTWDFSVVKPGYVMVGDKARMEFDEAGYLKSFIGFQANPFIASWSGYKVRIAPIKMEVANLSLPEQVAYYGTMAAAGCSNDVTSVRANLAWEHQMFNYWKPQICGASSNDTVNTPTAFALTGVAPDFAKAKRRLIELDPEFQSADPYNRPHQYRIGDLCQAMTAGEEQ